MSSNTFCIIKCKKNNKKTDDLDTGRKLNVQKTFGRHPSRLLNEHHLYIHFNLYVA